MNHRVVSVKSLHGYFVELKFDDGVSKVIDIFPFIGKGISISLRDKRYFDLVTLEQGGGICWPNGYDFCPNFLYEEVPAAKPVFQ